MPISCFLIISLNLVYFVFICVRIGLTSESHTPLEKLAALSSEVKVMKELITKLQQLEVDSTEYACLKGIVMFKAGILLSYTIITSYHYSVILFCFYTLVEHFL